MLAAYGSSQFKAKLRFLYEPVVFQVTFTAYCATFADLYVTLMLSSRLSFL